MDIGREQINNKNVMSFEYDGPHEKNSILGFVCGLEMPQKKWIQENQEGLEVVISKEESRKKFIKIVKNK